MNTACCSTLVLDLPYSRARRRILAALKEQGLRVEFDLDVSSGILRSSGVELAQASLLGVACPYQFLEAFVADGAAAVFFPLHVAITAHGGRTQIRTLASQSLRAAGVAPAIAIPAHRTWRLIQTALASSGARPAPRPAEETAAAPLP